MFCTSVVKPKITYISPEQTVISNNTAVFHCNATAKPVATINWLRVGSTLNKPQIKITYSTDGKNCNDNNPDNLCTSYSELQLSNTQPADSGSYLCTAINEYYSDSQSVNLIIQGKHYIRNTLTSLIITKMHYFACDNINNTKNQLNWISSSIVMVDAV